MRAPFDKLCDFLTGPTATPSYNPYIIGAECRRVPNELFRSLTPPLNGSVEYLTVDLAQPAGPQATDIGSDRWTLDYGRADRIRFQDEPGVLWKCLDVIACTGPAQQTYWRAAIVPTSEVPLTPCQKLYRTQYYLDFANSPTRVFVNKVTPVIWVGPSTIVQGEISGPPGLACSSTWWVINLGTVYSGPYGGGGQTRLFGPGGLTDWVNITSVG